MKRSRKGGERKKHIRKLHKRASTTTKPKIIFKAVRAGKESDMTKQELIEENNKLKAGLKEIYAYSRLSPIEDDEEEKKLFEEGRFDELREIHLANILAITVFTLIPDWYCYTKEERKAIIESIQTP